MRNVLSLLLVSVVLISIVGCDEMNLGSAGSNNMSVTSEPYGEVDGMNVRLYTLTNANDLVMKVTNYGGIITELWVPDRNGKLGDIVLGYDNVDAYVAKTPYFGALIGRYGNRIGGGKFSLCGVEYQLAQNDNEVNHLHGGVKGYDKVVWSAKPIETKQGVGLELKYKSVDGEEGYPGTLDITAIYMLTNDNEFTVEYHATTDKRTVCNLTQHNYYNLGGHASGPILDHSMMIDADLFTPTDDKLIPTGEIVTVGGTPMDFRTPTAIGDRVNNDFEALKFGGGYDHNWVLNKGDKQGKMTFAAKVSDPKSGRVMEVSTTEPAIQFYCGNFLDGTYIGKGGHAYEQRTAFCLETQHYPDSPNHSHFTNTVLEPGEKYYHKTVYKFSAK